MTSRLGWAIGIGPIGIGPLAVAVCSIKHKVFKTADRQGEHVLVGPSISDTGISISNRRRLEQSDEGR